MNSNERKSPKTFTFDSFESRFHTSRYIDYTERASTTANREKTIDISLFTELKIVRCRCCGCCFSVDGGAKRFESFASDVQRRPRVFIASHCVSVSVNWSDG